MTTPLRTLSRGEVMKLLGIGPTMLCELQNRRELKPTRIGRRVRFTEAELQRFLGARTLQTLGRGEVMKLLGIGPTTLCRLQNRRELKPTRIGRRVRFTEAEVARFVAARTR